MCCGADALSTPFWRPTTWNTTAAASWWWPKLPRTRIGLEAILAQAQANDVEGMERLTRAQAVALEPELTCEGALLSPQSGVFDSHGLHVGPGGRDPRPPAGRWLFRRPSKAPSLWRVAASRSATGGTAPAVLTWPLSGQRSGARRAARRRPRGGLPAGLDPAGRTTEKGVYFRLQGKAPFARLIYPTPIPGALGTHYRRDLGGQGVFGPDLHYIDAPDYSIDPSAADDFYRHIRRFWPALPDGDLAPDYVGVRPKIHGPGEAQPDFRIHAADVHGLAGLVALFGIESPGLTSSLAIGEEVAARLGFSFPNQGRPGRPSAPPPSRWISHQRPRRTTTATGRRRFASEPARQSPNTRRTASTLPMRAAMSAARGAIQASTGTVEALLASPGGGGWTGLFQPLAQNPFSVTSPDLEPIKAGPRRRWRPQGSRKGVRPSSPWAIRQRSSLRRRSLGNHVEMSAQLGPAGAG